MNRLQGKAFQWPTSENKTDSSASSSIQENDDSGRDSIDSRKIPQTKIPRVKFTCDGDSSASPSNSVSPADSVEYVLFNCLFNLIHFSFVSFFFSTLMDFSVHCVKYKIALWIVYIIIKTFSSMLS